MSALREKVALVLAAGSLALSAFLFFNRPPLESEANSTGSGEAASEAEMAVLNGNLNLLATDLEVIKHTLGELAPTPAAAGDRPLGETGDSNDDAANAFASVGQRIQALEDSLASLQSNYEGISLEGVSAERAELFASEEGALKADEYFEAGKFSIAAEGYLTYYRNHPDDPDARAVLDRARGAYARAGYQDMAIWVQEEKMRIFPENRAGDLDTLAGMNKRAGNYDAAIVSAAEAAELHSNPQQRLWSRLYWAWYNQLRDGSQAGLDAYLEVQREIDAAGYGGEHKLNENAQKKIDELRKNIAFGN